jgi:hypothetical protein
MLLYNAEGALVLTPYCCGVRTKVPSALYSNISNKAHNNKE